MLPPTKVDGVALRGLIDEVNTTYRAACLVLDPSALVEAPNGEGYEPAEPRSDERVRFEVRLPARTGCLPALVGMVVMFATVAAVVVLFAASTSDRHTWVGPTEGGLWLLVAFGVVYLAARRRPQPGSLRVVGGAEPTAVLVVPSIGVPRRLPLPLDTLCEWDLRGAGMNDLLHNARAVSRVVLLDRGRPALVLHSSVQLWSRQAGWDMFDMPGWVRTPLGTDPDGVPCFTVASGGRGSTPPLVRFAAAVAPSRRVAMVWPATVKRDGTAPPRAGGAPEATTARHTDDEIPSPHPRPSPEQIAKVRRSDGRTEVINKLIWVGLGVWMFISLVKGCGMLR